MTYGGCRKGSVTDKRSSTSTNHYQISAPRLCSALKAPPLSLDGPVLRNVISPNEHPCPPFRQNDEQPAPRLKREMTAATRSAGFEPVVLVGPTY